MNTDISKVDKASIPNFNLLVGGFPCQDYSVARKLKGEQGIEGKKVFYGGIFMRYLKLSNRLLFF